MQEDKRNKRALRIVVNLDNATYLRVKHAVLDTGRPLNMIVEEFLLKWLDEQERSLGKGPGRKD